MNSKRNWLIVLVVSAVAGSFAIQSSFRAGEGESIASPPTITDTVTLESPSETPTAIASFTPTFEMCAFMWAYEDLPGLTEKLDALVRALNSQATARAQAFGENCVYADGSFTFLARETDYYVHLPITDRANEEAFGNWMAQVLPLIEEFPPDEIVGPQPGFVEFWFSQSETEQVIVRVPIQQYLQEAQGKRGIELFRFFYIPPYVLT